MKIPKEYREIDLTNLIPPRNDNLEIISDYISSKYLMQFLNDKTIISIKQDLKYNLNDILQTNYDVTRLKFEVNIDFKSNVDIIFKPENLYSALVLHGIQDPDSYIQSGFHKLLDSGYYDKYYNEGV